MDAPEFNQLGGTVNAGFTLSMSNVSGGVVYYTLDGTDPRLLGGAISPRALTYSSALTLNSSARVKARGYNPLSHVLSAPTHFTLHVAPPPSPRITQLM